MNNNRLAYSLLLLLFISSVGFSTTAHSFSINSNLSIRTMIPSQTDTPIEIGSNPELAELSTAGVGTRSDPYIIEGKRITSVNCLYIHDTTGFFVVRDSEFIYMPNQQTILGSAVVRLERVEHGVIENCYVRGGDIAIEIRASTDCTIRDCSSFDSYAGILLDSSDNCTIVDCSIYSNIIGTRIFSTDSCNIINNSIYSNSQYGVHVYAFSENNTIFGNLIGWNAVHNAVDDGDNTEFTDSVSTGNEWSDYNSSVVYSIHGSGISTDLYATQLTDETRPTVLGDFDLVIDIESSGETITWTASDTFHSHYEIYINDELVEDRTWDGRTIEFSLEDLNLGTYTIDLNVTDGAGNVGRDVVVVSVISFILGGIGTELVMLASGVTVVCFVVIILFVKRFA